MTTFFVNNMSCGSCAKHITHAVKTLDPDAELAIDIPARTVKIASNKSTDELVNVIKALDYEVTIADG
jgi:copper chaperone